MTVMSFSYVVDFLLFSIVKLPALSLKTLHYAFKVLYNSNANALLLKLHPHENQSINTVQTTHTAVCWLRYSLGEH
jgi:hypothetical protein